MNRICKLCGVIEIERKYNFIYLIGKEENKKCNHEFIDINNNELMIDDMTTSIKDWLNG